ncbi:MAG: hypothetical protein ABI321_13105 [Polyangia bacterium]
MTAFVPPRTAQSVCTAADLDNYRTACLSPSAIPIACQQFVANHAACAACLAPAPTSSGPLLAHAGEVQVNVGGCIALVLGDRASSSCGARQQTAIDCVEHACAACNASCAAAAREGPCLDAQLHTCAELGPAATCALAKGFADDYRRVATLFCGARKLD